MGVFPIGITTFTSSHVLSGHKVSTDQQLPPHRFAESDPRADVGDVPQKLRVLIVEDDLMCGDSLRTALSYDPAVQEVRIAASFEDARRECLSVRPHVALVDWKIPGGSGSRLIEIMKPKLPLSTGWILMSAYMCADLVIEADRVNAIGVLDKHATAYGDVRSAIENAIRGRDYYSPIPRKLAIELLDTNSPLLTGRQRDVIRLLSAYRTRAEIARELGIGKSAVTKIIARIGERLGVPMPASNSCIVAAGRRANYAAGVPQNA